MMTEDIPHDFQYSHHYAIPHWKLIDEYWNPYELIDPYSTTPEDEYMIYLESTPKERQIFSLEDFRKYFVFLKIYRGDLLRNKFK